MIRRTKGTLYSYCPGHRDAFQPAKRPGQTEGHQGGGQIETRLDTADGLPCHPSAPGQFLLIQTQAQAERFQIIVEATAWKLGVRSHHSCPNAASEASDILFP